MWKEEDTAECWKIGKYFWEAFVSTLHVKIILFGIKKQLHAQFFLEGMRV